MSKILLLEDNMQRIIWFKENVGNKHQLMVADNVKDAIRIYNMFRPFDIIFLDHDLDGRVYVNSSEENTGYQFAKYLKSVKWGGTTYIHSLNEEGAKKMKGELPEAKIIPFLELKDQLII